MVKDKIKKKNPKLVGGQQQGRIAQHFHPIRTLIPRGLEPSTFYIFLLYFFIIYYYGQNGKLVFSDSVIKV